MYCPLNLISTFFIRCIYNITFFRFEWSVGYAGNDSPLGIYNQVEENVWQDAGQMKESIYTTKPG